MDKGQMILISQKYLSSGDAQKFHQHLLKHTGYKEDNTSPCLRGMAHSGHVDLRETGSFAGHTAALLIVETLSNLNYLKCIGENS